MKLNYTFKTPSLFADVVELVIAFAPMKLLDGSPMIGMDYSIYEELSISFETIPVLLGGGVLPSDGYMVVELVLNGVNVYFETQSNLVSNGYDRQRTLSPQLSEVTTKLFVLLEKDKLLQLKLNKELVSNPNRKEL